MRIYSTNRLERLHREARRRTSVVGIIPDPDAALRPVGSVLIEVNDKWQVGRRYFRSASTRSPREPADTRLAAPNRLRLAPIR